MHYMTIVHDLMQEQQTLFEKLTANNSLLSTMEMEAISLRQMHLELLEQMQQHHPNRSEVELKAEALEVAIDQWKERLSLL